MPKNLVIFALLFGLFASAHGDDHQPAASAPQSQKLASPNAPAAAEEHNSANLKQASPQEQADRDPETVRVILPRKDNYDYILFAVNIVLGAVGIAGVGVGIFGIIYAKNTLGQISIQTTRLGEHAEHFSSLATAAKDNANAALLNAQAVINAERAWITVTPHVGSPKFYPAREKNAPIPDNLVDILPIAHVFAGKLVNVGKTPARIEAAAIRYIRTSTHPSDLDAIPDYGEVSESVMFAFPNEVNTISANLSPTATLTQAQIEAVQNEKEFLYAFGIVKYRDVYEEPHETRFGYFYQVQDRHLVMKDGVVETIRTGEARFRKAGPPAYNGHT